MKTSILLKTSSILWIIWGIVHIIAGVMTMKGILTNDISSSVAGIADAVEPSFVQMDYSEASGAIIGQHGFNLFWIGIVTFISAFFVWKGNRNAIFLAAITGGLADLGYFLFMDLGGFVNFIPGTVMTIVSSLAIILSFYAYFKTRDKKLTQ
ncbi:MAG TPA: hypothetical protein DCL80_06840 [Balneola sp.]|jgi:hypothetical protein|nr:hypothetical protein [Balneola sp.]MAO78372.1 hypothetical protein [Balneola sp.]MBF64372.1 hypothetical protein [Balneola sp.]HAH50983.1 hypothetical protein [Balneola sp.]HAW81233.1 hypothetical protein [Balneola sp.]|tara:strand:- start:12455 stop:12910 length:456 start_codon:yes stop_codon:yes gene_type:complete